MIKTSPLVNKESEENYNDSDKLEVSLRVLKSELVQAVKDAAVPIRYMSLKQAAVYSGIGQKKLKELAKYRKIKGQRKADSARGDWSFDRESIDKYWNAPFDEIKTMAQNVFDRIKKRD